MISITKIQIQSNNKMSQYSIYKLSREDTDDVYYGSTKNTLKRRFALHKCKSKYGTNRCISRKLFEADNDVKIELMETCEATTVKDRESHYIRNFKCINKQIPNRSKKEYGGEYRTTHKEQIKKKRKLHDVGEVLVQKNERSKLQMRYNASHLGVIARAYF